MRELAAPSARERATPTPCLMTSYARFRPAPDVVSGGIWECPRFSGCFGLATKVRGSAGRRSQDQSPPCTVGTIEIVNPM